MNKVAVKYKILKEGHLPEYKHVTDACADCRANLSETVIIRPGERMTIPLGFAMGLPEGYRAVIHPRSGFARKNGVMAVTGIIDQDFIGEVGTTLINFGTEDFIVNEGDRICQICVEPYYHAEAVLVENLDATERGENGWGSSGV